MSLSDQIFEVVKQAGPAGIAPPQIAEKLGVEQRRLGYLVKQMADRCLLERLNPPRARPQLFVVAGRRQNLPPRSDSVTVINKAQPRNVSVSPERLRIENLLQAATVGLRPLSISKKTGVTLDSVRKIMWRLQRDRLATNVGSSKESIWRATGKIKAASDSARAMSERHHCNGTMPRARPSDIPRMECAR